MPENESIKKPEEQSTGGDKVQLNLWSLGRSFIKLLPLILLAMLFAFLFSRSDLITKLEKLTLVVQMHLNMPEENSNVVIVEITQQDFEEIFRGKTRPLNPEGLHRLINAVSKGEPCVIGVDIDTSFTEYQNFKIEPDWQNKIIWARTALGTARTDGQKPLALDVLGNQNLGLNKRAGLPYVIKDGEDHIVRRYERMIDTVEGKLPSLAWAIYKEGERLKKENPNQKCVGISFPALDENDPPRFIGYSRSFEGGSGELNDAEEDSKVIEGIGRFKIPASHILNFAESDNWNKELIKDKIVLIGGSYLGEDRHETPLGEMLGVEILANVIETELRGGGVKPLNWLTTALIAIFDGIILIVIFVYAEEKKIKAYKAILISVIVLLFLSFVCSLLTYHSFSYWAFFAPVMIGVLLTEIYDKAKDHLKVKYKDKISETFSAIMN